jgi:general secretion pathway protein D
MKKLIFAALFILLCNAAFAQDQGYDMNFKNVTMKEFVSFVASFTGINIVYNEADLRGNVSLSSQKPMSRASVMEIFNAVLQANGLVAVQERDYIQIFAEKEMPNYNADFSLNTADNERFVTTIIALDNYNVTALVNAFARVKSRQGNVEALRGMNVLLIRDFASRVERMRAIAMQMDKHVAGYQLYSVTVVNSLASRVEQQINRFFTELQKNNIIGQLPVVISDDVSNVLVVAATEQDYDKIRYMVQELDSGSSTNNLPRVFYLKYAKSEDVEEVLNKIFTGQPTPAAQQGARATTQTRTSVSSDNATNSIIAIGDAEFYSNLEHLIEKLDIARKQVYVEALILETSLDRGDSFGVEWFGAGGTGNDFGFINSRNSGGLGGVMGMVSGDENPNLGGLPGGFTGSLIGDVVLFNGLEFPSLGAFMNAARTDDGINIVSNPQILTLDNQEAEIFVGENRPFINGTKYDTNGNAINTFDYRDVGVRLKVTPHISGQDLVSLAIEQEVNSLSGVADNMETAPITLTRTTRTNVQLYNKTIMVVSGLMKDDSVVGTAGIPLLSDIPILGWLFKSKRVTTSKTNMTVFITAHIVDTRNDMSEVLRRRTEGTSDFNAEVDRMIADNMTRDSGAFIPLHQEVNKLIYSTEKEAAE